MVDCSKTAAFLTEWKRMCDTNILCEKCELRNADEETCTRFSSKSLCMLGVLRHVDKVIAVVQQWSDEHPMKTYADVFFEQHPFADAEIVKGIRSPCICRAKVYGGNKCSIGETKFCWECWHEPYPEQKGGA